MICDILPLNPIIAKPHLFKDDKEIVAKKYKHHSWKCWIEYNEMQICNIKLIINYHNGAEMVTMKKCRIYWIKRSYQIEVCVLDSISIITLRKELSNSNNIKMISCRRAIEYFLFSLFSELPLAYMMNIYYLTTKMGADNHSK